jgi:transposase
VNPHHRCVLTELLSQIDSLDEAIARVDAHIQAICGPVDEAVALLDTVPGVARRTAAMLAAEIGADMTRVPSADPLASWAGVAPGNHESAGKRASGKTRKGHRFLRTTLVQAAHAAGGPYRDAGADCFDRLQPEETARRPVKRLESLGYHATIQRPSTEALP